MANRIAAGHDLLVVKYCPDAVPTAESHHFIYLFRSNQFRDVRAKLNHHLADPDNPLDAAGYGRLMDALAMVDKAG